MVKKWILKRVPEGNDKGYPKPTLEDFECVSEPMPSEADLNEGEVILQHFVISVDPYVPAYSMGEKYLGKPIVASAAGKVVASRSHEFAPGDFAMSINGGATEVSVNPAGMLKKIWTLQT